MIQRLKNWWHNQPSLIEEELDGKVIIPKKQWDGFPSDADECRRTYTFGEGVDSLGFMNVNCPCCGDSILFHRDQS